jgi:hypothetical protein
MGSPRAFIHDLRLAQTGHVADLGWVGSLSVVASFLLFLIADRRARTTA